MTAWPCCGRTTDTDLEAARAEIEFLDSSRAMVINAFTDFLKELSDEKKAAEAAIQPHRDALRALVEAVEPTLDSSDPRRVVRRDVDNFPSTFAVTAAEREAIIEAFVQARALIDPEEAP